MGLEIERKFLIAGEGWQGAVTGVHHIRQAYLASGDNASIRVRIQNDDEASLTIKSANAGPSRAEFNYRIPVEDAMELLALRLGHIIEKHRHLVDWSGQLWEIDVFGGAHAGLIIAEVELAAADQEFARPDWLGREVTVDKRYYNATLAKDGPPV